ncbi:hypothetical protein [Alteribacillus sp. YIM 98480]|uniref:hypothetical protein n=1 Tax=Alteribacillus sp. YIM 98480 TaxID=2606599 RepID=UPI00131E2B45|nr:hypothetical protein [Alteribacillus sp. YIM 98480]
MKKQSTFYGILLAGIGLIMLIHIWNFSVPAQWLEWPTILLIAGLAFTAEALSSRASLSFLPGILLLLLGAHLHLVGLISSWPDHPGMYGAIIGIAILMDYLKTRSSGWFSGLLLLAVSGVYFFEEELHRFLDSTLLSPVLRFAPFVLLGVGLYLTLLKKR